MGRISVRIPDQLEAELDEKLVNSRYKNRSDFYRDITRRYVDGLLSVSKPLPARERI